MKTNTKRLREVEAALTPKQRVLQWLEEARKTSSLVGYCQIRLGQPVPQPPATELTEAAAEEVRKRLKGKPYEVTRNAVQHSLRNVMFLLTLAIETNVLVMSKRTEFELTGALCARSLQLATFLESASAAAKKNADGLGPSLGETRRDIVAFATEASATRQAVDHISRRFFDGRTVLFTSTEQDLSDAEQTARTLLEAFNEVAAENGHGGGKGKGKKHAASALAGGRPRPIEKGTFQETVHAVMLSLVHKKVTESNAHAAWEVGETDLAAEMLKSLHSNGP